MILLIELRKYLRKAIVLQKLRAIVVRQKNETIGVQSSWSIKYAQLKQAWKYDPELLSKLK